jgi:aerobic C4-dicarboxylate transport protein
MTTARRPWYTVLYIQVLLAIALGIIIGHFFPNAGVALKPLGDGFISLIKMMIAPVIFCTVVHGIGSMRDLKKVGRVGVKTLFYFETVSTLALVIGLVVGKLLQPGRGFDIDPATLDANAVASYVNRAKEEGFVAHLLEIIPDTFIGAFARGDLLQVLLVSILTASPSRVSGSWARRSTMRSMRWQRSSSASLASSCARRRSARSAQWPSPSVRSGWPR